MILHANHLKTICMIYQNLFSGKIRKNINFSSAEYAHQSVVKVKSFRIIEPRRFLMRRMLSISVNQCQYKESLHV